MATPGIRQFCPNLVQSRTQLNHMSFAMAKKEYFSIVLLIVSLVIVLSIIWFLKRNMSLASYEVPQLPNQARVGVLDSLYINHLQFVTVTRPGPRWQMTVLSEQDSIALEDTNRTVLENTVPLLEMTPVNTAEVPARIVLRVMRYAKTYDAERLALQQLSEIFLQYHRKPESVALTLPVTKTVYRSLPGAFFMVVLPGTAREPLPVWVCATAVRDRYAYIFLCQTTDAFYPSVKDDFEKAIKSIRAIRFPQPKSK